MIHAYTHHTNTISFILGTSLPDPYHALHMTDLHLSGRTQLNSQPYQKPSLVQLNRFLKIFLRRSQSMETKPVKSIPKDFSKANPSMKTKPVKSIPKIFSDADPFNVIISCLVRLNLFLKIFLLLI